MQEKPGTLVLIAPLKTGNLHVLIYPPSGKPIDTNITEGEWERMKWALREIVKGNTLMTCGADPHRN